MSEAIVAKRYAEALFQLAEEKDMLDQFVEEFRLVQDVLKDNEQLFTFLTHPQINNGQKKQLIKEVFQNLQKDVVNTIQLLVEKQRMEYALSIIDHFIQLVNDAKGIAEATVYSVRKLTDKEKGALEENFSKRFNKKAIKFKNIVDPSIIGGLRIRVGNTIYDGSISAKLNRIERDIVTANK